MEKPIYIFAGGGTGGHLYPGLSVAKAMIALSPAARIVFACSNRPIDARILDGEPYGIVVQPVAPLPTSAAKLPAFLRAWRASRRLARDMIADLQPAGVLGLGGFAAGPVVRTAAEASVRTGLLNPDAVVGKANAYLARYVEAIFTQFESVRSRFRPQDRDKVRCTGCPVRPHLVDADRDEAVRFFGLDAGKKTLLVLGGSQGARSINLAIGFLADDLDSLADEWQVLHVAGPDRERSQHGPTKLHTVRLDYCERMDLAYAAADLALCRSGAGTIAELMATKTPAAVMPYPHHADRQQRLNAEPLVAAGSAVLIDDRQDPPANAEGLRGVLLAIMRDRARLDSMRSALAGSTRPDAATTIAKWLGED